jgi:hypothetical protein
LDLAAAYERSGTIELAEKQFADATRVSGFNPNVGLAYVAFLRRRGSTARARPLRITAVDAIGNNAQERRIIGGVIAAPEAPIEPPRLLKANDAVIAWTGPTTNARRAPAGSVCIGRFADHTLWSSDYASTAGAVHARRRKIKGAWQRFEVMLDWYRIAFVFGLDPAIVHRAFLEIEDYQALIKERDCDVEEFDARPKPPMEVFRGAAGSLHVWPKPVQ